VSETGKHIIDVASLGTFIAYLTSMLPVLALIFTVVWSVFRVLEMRTTHVILHKLFGVRMDKWLYLPEYKEVQDKKEDKE